MQKEVTGSSKKCNRRALNDILGVSVDDIVGDLIKIMPPKKKPRLKKKKKIAGMTKEQASRFAKAVELYIDGKFVEAKSILQNLIKVLPKEPMLYENLGTIYESMGNKRKALHAFILAASTSPKPDLERWRSLAHQGEEAGSYESMMSVHIPKNAQYKK